MIINRLIGSSSKSKTQKNILLVPLWDPAGVGALHCQVAEGLIANQELQKIDQNQFGTIPNSSTVQALIKHAP